MGQGHQAALGEVAAVNEPTPEVGLRPASPDEAAALTELAIRSKAYWGYADAFMRRAREELTLTAALVETDHVEVLSSRRDLVGFMRLRRELDYAELIDLFVEPARIGHGHGKRLFGRAVEIARGWEISAIELDSDPNAEPFYRSRGMQRMDARPSPVDRTRLLPRMRLELS